MRAVLEIEANDLNNQLIDVIDLLFKKNVNEVVLKKNNIVLEEFDSKNDISEIIQSMREAGHNDLFLKEIENGLKNSSVYKQ